MGQYPQLLIDIPTTALKQLLEQNPEVKLKIASMACEKIAEEVKRKVTADAIMQVQAEVLGQVREYYRAEWKLPKEVKEFLERLVNRVFKEYVKSNLDDAVRTAAADAAKRVSDDLKDSLAITINRTVKDEAEKQVMALIRGARKL